jgi:kynurenine formamidase
MMRMPRYTFWYVLWVVVLTSGCSPAPEDSTTPSAAVPNLAPNVLFTDYDVVDLSVTVSETMPAHWAANPPMQRWTYNWFAPQTNAYGTVQVPSEGPYYGQRYVIDEHTGTQTDFPAHFIPPPNSGLPHAGPMGALTGDKYPLDRMMGPAVVIDVTSQVDEAENGKSAAITLAIVQKWEKEHGEIRAGEVVLFHSSYTDKYYKPLPEGLRMTFEPVVAKSSPGWPAPTPEVMEYLRKKGVWHLGTDGPSMGPAEGGQAVHVAGLKHGMSWEEMLIGLDRLPARGAFYVALPLKVVDQSGSPARAIAFVPKEK